MARSPVVRPLVVASHPHNNSLVVLVHGILSARFSAWEPVIDLIQTICERNGGSGVLASYDYYAFGYRSSLVQQPPFESLIPELRALVRRERYDSVVLIGHSQGGVLAKLYLIDELERGELTKCKVDLVITLDTPHAGPALHIYPAVLFGAIWKRLPVLNRWPLWRQAADLAYWSTNLKRLRAGWNAANFPTAPCAPQARRRHVRSYAVSGARLPLIGAKAVVPRKSAAGFAIDEPIVGSTRASIGLGHGVHAMQDARYQIERLLAEHEADNARALRAALPALSPDAVERVVREACDAAALRCEMEIWRRRIAQGFARRPLRGIPQPADVAAKLIRLRREHP